MSLYTESIIQRLRIQLAMEGEWEEQNVKRDKLGRFAPKNSSGSESSDIADDSNIFQDFAKGLTRSVELEVELLGDTLGNVMKTVQGESKKRFDDLVGSELFKSINKEVIDEEIENFSKTYGDKLDRLFTKASEIIENNQGEESLDIGGVVNDTIKEVSKNIGKANENQLELLAGGLVLGSTIALAGMLAGGVLPIATQMAVGGVGIDLILTSSLIDDYRDTLNLNKDPKEIVETIKKRSDAEGEDTSQLGTLYELTDQMKERHLKRIQEIERKKTEIGREIGRQHLENVGKEAKNILDNNREKIRDLTAGKDQEIVDNIEKFKEEMAEKRDNFKEMLSGLGDMMKEDIENLGVKNRKSNLRMGIETLQKKIDEIVID
mgnify:CR=1 FL=1